ncbi:MAG TPA: DUF4350 domain-containing protein [Microbacterium sp.]|nr:DUF4350 domain-containing protein [Microbacterium sp.]
MTLVEAPSTPSASGAPAGRARRRRAGAWVALAVVLLVVGGAGAALTAAMQWQDRGALDPDSPGPEGTRALAQVLRSQGVEVTVARDRAAAESALAPGDTLVLGSTAVLSDETLRAVAGRTADVVLLDPGSRDLRLLLSGAQTAGVAPDTAVAPACADADATRAGAVAPGALFTAPEGVTGCYPVDGDYGLIVHDRVVAVDGAELFTNAHLAEGGNAALALGLTGKNAHLVWYLPSPGDADAGTAVPTIGELTPPWVTPAILLLLAAATVAAVWRGRRFGPLVAERLPVTVRASETMAGRARLYARSRDTAHTLDALRTGTLDRLARLLGLGPAARAGEIADAAADRLGAPRAAVRGILIDDAPATDAQLVAASDRLRGLEQAVRASVHLERTDP